MKKFLFVLVLFIFCFQSRSFSQRARAGVSAGVNFSNMSGKDNGTDLKGDGRTGFMAGFVVDVPIGKKKYFSFMPGAYYVQKGKTDRFAADTVETALRYVEFPFNFVFNVNSKSGTFYVGGGPYVDFAFPSKFVTTRSGQETSSDISFGNKSADNLRGYDWGVNALAGYRLSMGVFLAVNYSQGLLNLLPRAPEDQKLHNRYIGVQLGILMNNKK
jgi:hypothetical protein